MTSEVMAGGGFESSRVACTIRFLLYLWLHARYAHFHFAHQPDVHTTRGHLDEGVGRH